LCMRREWERRDKRIKVGHIHQGKGKRDSEAGGAKTSLKKESEGKGKMKNISSGGITKWT